jgi:phosphoribosylaminoimidazolecarboxamide formyltransferase/IMP cyclohydrolase
MNSVTPQRKRALVSVSDKTDLAAFARGLVDLGFEIVSTGGTRRFLEENGIPVIDVSSYTGFPEIMEGRVKTLHPKVHGAILGRPTDAGDAAAIREHGIVPFQVVVCNLYPFEKTVARPDVAFDDAIEQIDVGGPSMVRAAAKNHAHVAVVTDPRQYPRVLESLRSGELSSELRRELAWAAFERTAAYDRGLAGRAGHRRRREHEVPRALDRGAAAERGLAIRREPSSARGVLPALRRARFDARRC